MLKTNIATALATGAICLAVCAPAAFADTVSITGNGADSTNKVTINNTTNCTVSQSNSSVINTGVSSSANTGGNSANSNTGGDVSVTTGDASNTTTVSVTGSMNDATNPCCACATQGLTADVILGSAGVTIDSNGEGSHNKVKVHNTSNTTTGQANSNVIGTSVGSKAKTGKNKANKNTGPGSTSVDTGSSTNVTTVTVGGSSNSL